MPVSVTEISWTDISGNHWVGCAKVSEGCLNCWSAATAARYDRTPEPWTVEHIDANLQVYDEDIADLLSKYPANEPAWCFYPSSSDPFLPWLSDEAKREYWQSIEANEHICFQVLTKWGPEVQRAEQGEDGVLPHEYEPKRMVSALPDHVMLGVTVETELREYRLDWLREQEAAVKFVSFEPLLEDITDPDLSGIDWAIVGGETGENRRPWDADWARSIYRACEEQGVEFFFKQHGDRYPEERTTLVVDWEEREFNNFPETPEGVLDRPRKHA